DWPRDGMEARFSLRYNVAAALALGAVGLAAFEDASLGDPRVRAAFERVLLVAGGERGGDATRLRMRLRDGRVLEHATALRGGTAERDGHRLQPALGRRIAREVRRERAPGAVAGARRSCSRRLAATLLRGRRAGGDPGDLLNAMTDIGQPASSFLQLLAARVTG